MKVVGWATGVNQRIIDETTWSIGEGGRIKDSSSTGYEEERATALAYPNKFKVVMYFDWGGNGSEFQEGVDSNGYTEYDRFIRWYKFICKNGANSFWFPSITKTNMDTIKDSEHNGCCLYKIDSGLQISKSGYSMKVTMDWKEMYSGVISMPTQSLELININASNGRIIVNCNSIPASIPTIGSINLYIKTATATKYGTATEIKNITQKNRQLFLDFTPLTTKGNYKAKITTATVTDIPEDTFTV